MSRVPSFSIVKNTGPLSEDFIPETFAGREGLVQEIAASLVPVCGGRVLGLWLHGPSGSGKTSVARSVLGQLEEQRVRTAYVNCWTAQTFHSVLETVFDELRALVAEMRDVSFKYERLARLARENPVVVVVVLDEVDQMLPRERNATLYNLSRLEAVALVCLTQSRAGYLSLDSRVRSRFRPSFLEFPRYSPDQLLAILQQRAEQSLQPEAWCLADLKWIVEASSGDARIAIQTLRTAAYLAEKSRASQLRVKDMERGLLKSSQLRRHYQLRGLSEHHRLLYRLVKEAERVDTIELWKRYRKTAREQGLEPMARRTFNHYKQYLVTTRLLTERQGRGKRNKRVLEVVV